jgi:hypothetical protein
MDLLNEKAGSGLGADAAGYSICSKYSKAITFIPEIFESSS